MTIEEFNKLSDQEKNVQLFEAYKLAERLDGFFKYELFKIDNFFVETKTGHFKLLKRTIACYTPENLPLVYSSALPSFSPGT